MLECHYTFIPFNAFLLLQMRYYINEQCYTNVGQNIRINTASIFFFNLKNNFHINNCIDKMDLHEEELKNSTAQP